MPWRCTVGSTISSCRYHCGVFGCGVLDGAQDRARAAERAEVGQEGSQRAEEPGGPAGTRGYGHPDGGTQIATPATLPST